MTPMEELREQAAKIAESYISGGIKPAHGWTDDQVRWWGFGVTDAAAAIRSAILALPLQAGEVESVAWTVWDGGTVPSIDGRDGRKGLIWFTHENEQEAIARGETKIFYWPWFGEDRMPCVRAYRLAGEATPEWCMKMAAMEGEEEIDASMPDHPLCCPSTPTEIPTAATPDDGLMGRYRDGLARVVSDAGMAANMIDPTNDAYRSMRDAFIIIRDRAAEALSTATGDVAQQGEW